MGGIRTLEEELEQAEVGWSKMDRTAAALGPVRFTIDLEWADGEAAGPSIGFAVGVEDRADPCDEPNMAVIVACRGRRIYAQS